VYVQLSRPVAACQCAPPSVETSTAATIPPPVSVAVPVTVTLCPEGREAFGAGEVIVELGAVASVDCVSWTRPLCSVSGCAPMSASRLTVACCMRPSGAGTELPDAVECWSSRPRLHWVVPAPKTSAPLGAR
jgi:hypothetical protein